tara:strand:+ start:165 stop:689 length:525 start_codon:yes stop_codon:yes gene_type:complete
MRTLMQTNGLSIVFFLGLMLGMTSCNLDPKSRKIQYMPDMADAPTNKPQESYIDPPEHSVPITGILYPEQIAVAEKELLNSEKMNAETLAKGKQHYDTFCGVCHGAAGTGKHTLGSAYPLVPPDLTRDDLKARKDGFFFMKITQGGAQMPSYGHAISSKERWQIVHYLRKLQTK